MHPRTEALMAEVDGRLNDERRSVPRPVLAIPENAPAEGDDDWLPYVQDLNDSYDLQEQAYQDANQGVERAPGEISNRYLMPNRKTVMGIDVATGERVLNRGNFENQEAASNYYAGVKRLRNANLNMQDGYDPEGVAGAAHVAAGVLAEGGTESDFNRAMDRMNMPKWQARAAWNAAASQRSAVEIENALLEPYDDDEVAAAGDPVDEDLTRDQLMSDEGWQTAAKQLWLAEQGEEFQGQPAELMNFFVDEFTNFNWKIAHVPGVGSSSMAYYAARAVSQGKEYAENFLALMDYYDRMKTDTGLFVDAFTDVLADPTTYVGLGGGAVAARAMTQVAKNRMRKGLQSFLAEAAGGAGAGFIEGGVYGAIDDTQRQRVEVAAGEREEIDLKQTAVVAGVSSVAGIAVGGFAGGALSDQARAMYKRGARQMVRQGRRPSTVRTLAHQAGSVGEQTKPKRQRKRSKK